MTLSPDNIPAEDDDNIVMVDADEACRVLGGNRPINRSTLYRGMHAGIYPKPVKLGPKTSRWIRADLIATIRQLAAEQAD